VLSRFYLDLPQVAHAGSGHSAKARVPGGSLARKGRMWRRRSKTVREGHHEHKRPPCTKAQKREPSLADARTSTLRPSAGQQAYQRTEFTPLSHPVQPYVRLTVAVVLEFPSVCCRERTLQSPCSCLEAYIVMLACKRDTFGFKSLVGRSWKLWVSTALSACCSVMFGVR